MLAYRTKSWKALDSLSTGDVFLVRPSLPPLLEAARIHETSKIACAVNTHTRVRCERSNACCQRNSGACSGM